jgi:hypothetical protein
VTPPIFNGMPGLNSCESQPKPMRGMRDIGELDKMIPKASNPKVLFFGWSIASAVQMAFGK